MYVYIVTSIVHHQARTVVAAPSSVVKCVWEVFVWGVVLFVCVCVCCCRGCCSLSVCVCVCDLLIFLLVLSGVRLLPKVDALRARPTAVRSSALALKVPCAPK